MASPLQELDGARLDVLVLGAGISGVATARELALRGYEVALVEPHDVAWGTSGRSSRLIHGGLRYLAGGHLRLVRQSLAARLELVRAAPHLARPCPFVVPFGQTDPASWRFAASWGVRLYDLLSRPRHGWPAPREIGREEARVLIPGLDPGRFRRALLYHDGWTDDRRLTLVTALDARRAGARLALRCELVGLEPGERGARATLRDRLTGETAALDVRSIVNATGAWADRVRASLGLAPADLERSLVRPTRGAHLVFAGRIDGAALLRHPRDGRVVFLIPGTDGFMAGTTDEDDGQLPDDVRATGSDDEYLVELVRHALPREELAVRASFAGLRPLVAQSGDADKVSRKSRLVEERASGVPLISIVGGKVTLHRPMARSAADRVSRSLGAPPRPAARIEPHLPGGDLATVPGEEAAARAGGLTSLQARWMVARYGSMWREVIEAGQCGVQPVGAGEIPLVAEIPWAVAEEELRTASDLLLRWRLPEIVDDEFGIAEETVDRLAGLCGWTEARRVREHERWKKDRGRMYGVAMPAPSIAT